MSRRRSTEPNSNGENGLQAATLASVSRTGMNPQPSGSSGQSEEPNPLTSFAQHVLGTNNNHLQSPQDSSDFLGLDNEGEIFTQEPAQGFEELLESDANRPRNDNPDNTLKEAVEVMDGLSHEMSYQGEMEHEQSVHDHGMGQAPPPPERTRRGKRRREDEETNGLTSMAGGEGADGELDISLLDPVRMKKDSHKEVERRRRENINDGINELAKYVPGGMDKGGKGAFLRRAAEYLGELSEKVRIMETEYGARESNHDLQAQVNRLQAQLVEEQERSIRYETSWREAEDRAAASQFQLARVEQDLRYLETEREM